ncbi:hypothetical protein A2159_02650 [Candidatus Woesebacteria bacterium RBG_13_34_9]|uniref:Uncharacterized protein n=1 Tax=Candidatus Woesebacteria bacterium RBG_13_34_9 TaxID=1802477 RepID=A0A1F7X0R0_9BACT|nr:MAG: hypothetical protein A2159_02650 [Candidatus Woesebacteria bacterium RBG_13_34_9]
MTEIERNDRKIEGIVQHAIFKELSENPYCPLPGLMQELLNSGDPDKIEMAYQIAQESLQPRGPNIIEKLFRVLKRSNP